MNDETIQAIQLHVSLDRQHGVASPNDSWPQFLADYYNKLSKQLKEKIMTIKLSKKEVKTAVTKAVEKVAEKKVVKKVKTPKVSKRISASGKYKNMRHLMESLFHANEKTSKEDALKIVKKEYPESKYLDNSNNHFSWYYTHIIRKGEWNFFDKPKGKVAKIKTSKQAA